MWNSFEKRKFPRVEKECGITLKLGDKQETFPTKTTNIGVGGFSVYLPKTLAPFSKVQISLSLQDGEGPFECESRVAWSIKNSNFDPKLVHYDVGFEFLELADKQKARIEKFLTTIA